MPKNNSRSAPTDATPAAAKTCREPDCVGGYTHEDGEVSLCWSCSSANSTAIEALEHLIETEPERDPWVSLADSLALDKLRRGAADS